MIGSNQATRPKPCLGGSTYAIVPYSWIKASMMCCSDSPLARCWSISFSSSTAVAQGPEKAPPGWAQPPAVISQPLQRHLMCMPISLARGEYGASAIRSGTAPKATNRQKTAMRFALIMAFSQGGRRSQRVRRGRHNRLGLRRGTQHESGATIRHQSEQRAHDDPNAAEPDPFHQRIEKRVDHRNVGIRIHAGIDDVEVLAQCGVNGDHCAGLLLVALELPLFGIKHHDLLIVFEDFYNHALRGVILLDLGVGALQNQGVRAELYGLPEVHGLLYVLVEGSAGETDKHEHHAEVHDVAAVTAGVAHREFMRRHHQAHASACGNHFGAAVEL